MLCLKRNKEEALIDLNKVYPMGQYEIYTFLTGNKGKWFSINELAAAVPMPTTKRCVRKLIGIVGIRMELRPTGIQERMLVYYSYLGKYTEPEHLEYDAD